MLGKIWKWGVETENRIVDDVGFVVWICLMKNTESIINRRSSHTAWLNRRFHHTWNLKDENCRQAWMNFVTILLHVCTLQIKTMEMQNIFILIFSSFVVAFSFDVYSSVSLCYFKTTLYVKPTTKTELLVFYGLWIEIWQKWKCIHRILLLEFNHFSVFFPVKWF